MTQFLFLTATALIAFFICMMETRSRVHRIQLKSISESFYHSFLKREYTALLPIIACLMLTVAFLEQDLLLLIAFFMLVLVPATGDYKSKYSLWYHFVATGLFFSFIAVHAHGWAFYKALLLLLLLKAVLFVVRYTRKRSTYWTEVVGVGYVITYLSALLLR
ncbi:hypothetical protein OAC88_02845 [Flavobacteriaceae bacterium]|nr:hypothetical protein [Flavobacteriaceae bacterium]